MTRKDYKLIARCINEAAKEIIVKNIDKLKEDEFAYIIGTNFCPSLKADNTLFKQETFLEACKNG